MQAVTFDVGGTLIAPWPSVGEVYAEAAAGHGLCRPDPRELNRRFQQAWRERTGFDYTAAAWARLVDATFAGLSPVPPSQSFFPELYRRFALAAAWRVFDGVHGALGALDGLGLKLGIISNWDERLVPLLDELGLSGYFDAIVVSHQIGAIKPDRRIFHHAAEKLGVVPGAVIHVGDSEIEDIRGATQAGFQALWIRPEAGEFPGAIADVAGVATWIERRGLTVRRALD